MKSGLLERLSKEKPENDADEMSEALRRGYSLRQIMKVLQTENFQVKPRKGTLKYRWSDSTTKEEFEVPYTYETFTMLCRKIL